MNRSMILLVGLTLLFFSQSLAQNLTVVLNETLSESVTSINVTIQNLYPRARIHFRRSQNGDGALGVSASCGSSSCPFLNSSIQASYNNNTQTLSLSVLDFPVQCVDPTTLPPSTLPPATLTPTQSPTSLPPTTQNPTPSTSTSTSAPSTTSESDPIIVTPSSTPAAIINNEKNNVLSGGAIAGIVIGGVVVLVLLVLLVVWLVVKKGKETAEAPQELGVM